MIRFVSLFLALTIPAVMMAGCAKPHEDDGPARAEPRPDETLNSYLSAPDLTATVEGDGRRLVSECAARIPIGRSSYVDHSYVQLCKLPHDIFKGQARYRITNHEDGIHVGLKLRIREFPRKTPPERVAHLIEQTRACVPQLRAVWARYGITLDLRFDSADAPTEGRPMHSVQVVDDYCTSHETKFCFLGYASQPLEQRQENYCKMILHETAHMLGLEDEYPTTHCPDRPFVSTETRPWSIMSNEYHPWEMIDFYPRHIRALIAPLCRD